MKHIASSHSRGFCAVWVLALLVAPGDVSAEPSPAAVSAFNGYVSAVELRLEQQHRSQPGFLVFASSSPEAELRLRRGWLNVEQLSPHAAPTVPGAMIHHWRGTAFVAEANAADFERFMRDFNAYPRHFQPQVLQVKELDQQEDRFQIWMRVRQHHVITVVMDTIYDVAFGHLDPRHGYSFSRSARVSEINSPGTSSERALNANQEHGFLWRLNTYWSYEERDGGLYIQIESVSLTRDIPRGLAWVIGPLVQRIPRESLEFTLDSTRNALQEKRSAPK